MGAFKQILTAKLNSYQWKKYILIHFKIRLNQANYIFSSIGKFMMSQ